MNVFILTLSLVCLYVSLIRRVKAEPATEDYCMLESFQPRCPRNEVILMKSATYGRMRIGRCITTEEIDEQKTLSGDVSRFLGCSADVLPLLDRKCSGKVECNVRMSDISAENFRPCFPGLTVYLEVSYECIDVVDGTRSCSVLASKRPSYLIDSYVGQRICGTKSQPWILEAPIGQKINISLFDFTTSNSGSNQGKVKQHCENRGLIVDKAEKKNVSICLTSERRQKELYMSAGNVVTVVFSEFSYPESDNENVKFMLKVEAVGCSDIVPPEDSWLKRNNDAIVIGCYSTHQTWRLICKEGIWAGVLGNCSNDKSNLVRDSSTGAEVDHAVFNDKHVLVIVAIGGFTLTICLVIICAGAVYLRRFYVQFQKKQDYKTLNFQVNSSRSQSIGQRLPLHVTMESAGNDADLALKEQTPTYSVYAAGQSDSTHFNTQGRADDANKFNLL